MNSSKQSSLRISPLSFSRVFFPFVAALAVAIVWMSPPLSAASSNLRDRIFAQDEGASDEDAIPTDQVDKYIAVYSAMQKNHSLSVEQAASKQGLTVDQFRTLEDKIERNPVVHERVLAALKKQTSGAKAASGSASH